MAKRGMLVTIAFIVLISGCGVPFGETKHRKEYYGLFDTFIEFSAYALAQIEFDKYSETVHGRLKELNDKFDIYNEYGGLNNIRTINENAGIAPVAVDSDIIGLLEFSKQAYYETNGAVNIAMGPVLSIWHKYREAALNEPESAALPPIDALLAAAENTEIENVIIDAENETVFLKEKGMALDVGALAKGYAARLALEAAKAEGLGSAVLNAGGNIIALGKPQDGRQAWSIGVLNSEDGGILDTVSVTDLSVVTSGAYQRCFTVDGKEYNHIISPDTLFPADSYNSVVVLHEDSGVADMLSTACFILPKNEAEAILKKHNAEALWVMNDGTFAATDGYKRVSQGIFK